MKQIATVGELRDFLAAYSADTPVNVRGYDGYDYTDSSAQDFYIGELRPQDGKLHLLVACDDDAVANVLETQSRARQVETYRIEGDALLELVREKNSAVYQAAKEQAESGGPPNIFIPTEEEKLLIRTLSIGGTVAWEDTNNVTHQGTLEDVRGDRVLLVRLATGDALWVDHGDGRRNLRVVPT